MTVTMSISLPQSLKTFVEEQAAKEGYGTVSEYLRAVILNLQKGKAKKKALDAQLLKGARSPSIRMTDKRWDELERKVRKRSPELNQG